MISTQFAHLSLLLNPDKTKLSKRQGDVAVEDYRAQGYLPEALVNFVALLGWNPGTEQEIFSLPELVQQFDFAKIHKAGAIFDRAKLDWMNGEYLKRMNPKTFSDLAMPILEKKFGALPGNAHLILELEKQRISRLNEVGDGVSFLFTDELSYDPAFLVWKKSNLEAAIKNLTWLTEKLAGYPADHWSAEELNKNIVQWIGENGLTNGEVLWPMRVALTGAEKSPTPFEVAAILGPTKTLARIQAAIKLLQK